MLTRDLFVVDDVLAKCRADIQVHVRCRISKSVVTRCQNGQKFVGGRGPGPPRELTALSTPQPPLAGLKGSGKSGNCQWGWGSARLPPC